MPPTSLSSHETAFDSTKLVARVSDPPNALSLMSQARSAPTDRHSLSAALA